MIVIKKGSQQKNEKKENEILEQNAQGWESQSEKSVVMHYTYEFNNNKNSFPAV